MSCVYCKIDNPFSEEEISYYIFKQIKSDLTGNNKYRDDYLDNSKLTNCREGNVSDKLFILMKQIETKQLIDLTREWKKDINSMLSTEYDTAVQMTDSSAVQIIDRVKSPLEKLIGISKYFGEYDCRKLQPQHYSSLFDECFRTFEWDQQDLSYYLTEQTREITFVLDDDKLWVTFKLLSAGGYSRVKYRSDINSTDKVNASDYMDDETIDVKLNKTVQVVGEDLDKFISKTNSASFLINVDSAIKLIEQITKLEVSNKSTRQTSSHNSPTQMREEIVTGLKQDLFDILNNTKLLEEFKEIYSQFFDLETIRYIF